jgi:hypothetical protein
MLMEAACCLRALNTFQICRFFNPEAFTAEWLLDPAALQHAVVHVDNSEWCSMHDVCDCKITAWQSYLFPQQ